MTTWQLFFACIDTPTKQTKVQSQLGHLVCREAFEDLTDPRSWSAYWKITYTHTRNDPGTRLMQLRPEAFVEYMRALWPDLFAEKIEKHLAARKLRQSKL